MESKGGTFQESPAFVVKLDSGARPDVVKAIG